MISVAESSPSPLTLIFWDDFHTVAFIPLPPSSDLCLNEFSPLASFLFASMQSLDAQQLF